MFSDTSAWFDLRQIATAMSGGDNEHDDHENDVVMPGFRFYLTEEELVEFYLRRKVEGKSFNVELISFLDLYRYDPWELPALASIGEKECFFYVLRDRKYRNGDRPNRVTTSGYWKATGADRMIRTETSRPIGLKKTLVFYFGKAPKGVRTCWIMNEYRLPQIETSQAQAQKAEISLCRVYKRAGVEDDHCRRITSRESKKNVIIPNHPPTNISISQLGVTGTSPMMSPAFYGDPWLTNSTQEEEEEDRNMEETSFNTIYSSLLISSNTTSVTTALPSPPPPPSTSSGSSLPEAIMEELNRLMEYNRSHLPNQLMNFQPMATSLPANQLAAAPAGVNYFSDKLWEYWNNSTAPADTQRDYKC